MYRSIAQLSARVAFALKTHRTWRNLYEDFRTFILSLDGPGPVVAGGITSTQPQQRDDSGSDDTDESAGAPSTSDRKRKFARRPRASVGNFDKTALKASVVEIISSLTVDFSQGLGECLEKDVEVYPSNVLISETS